MRILWACLLFLFSRTIAHGQLEIRGWGFSPVPDGVSVSLKLPERAVIGEAVLGQFEVRNTGSNPFKISVGGDAMPTPTSAPLRLRVRMTRSDGLVAPHGSEDLWKSQGGPSLKGATIEPGESYSIDFPLQSYALPLKPGIYKVEACHDLGWRVEKSRPHPVAAAQMEWILPSTEEMAKRVVKLCATNDQKSAWELCNLRNPMFLAPLVDQVKAGHLTACNGLLSIATEEASEALLTLTKSPDQNVAKAAGAALVQRISLQDDLSKPVVRTIYVNGGIDLPQMDLFKAWPAKLDASLMDTALRFLMSDDGLLTTSPVGNFMGFGDYPRPEMDLVALGAQYVEARGGPEQSLPLLEALHRALAISREPSHGPYHVVLMPPEPINSLIRAVDALRRRGWRTNGKSGITQCSDAGYLAYFRQLADADIPRKGDEPWEESVQAVFGSFNPIVREAAVRAIRLPLTNLWEEKVRTALDDEDWSVVTTACQIAEKSGRKSLLIPVCQVLETVHCGWVQDAANRAALGLGGRMEVWNAWCENIADKRSCEAALCALISGTMDVERSVGSVPIPSGDRFVIRSAWRKFLSQNREALEKGERVPISDPTVLPVLAGAGLEYGQGHSPLKFRLKDGTLWPAKEGKRD